MTGALWTGLACFVIIVAVLIAVEWLDNRRS